VFGSWDFASIKLAEFSRCEREGRTETVGRCHEQCEAVVGPGLISDMREISFKGLLPSQISKGSTVKIANYTKRSLLLCVVQQDRILSSNSIHHSIR